MSKDIYEKYVNRKKSLHITMTKDSHFALKMECEKRDLSMQEVLEAFANKIAVEDRQILKFLDSVKEDKILGLNKRTLKKTEINNIYDILENDED